MKTFFKNIYIRILTMLGLIERRCGWCKKLLGWKRAGLMQSDQVTHGICKKCDARLEASGFSITTARPKRWVTGASPRPRKWTRRRKLGGWGGGAAAHRDSRKK